MRTGSVVLTAMAGLFLSACGRSAPVESEGQGHHSDSASAEKTDGARTRKYDGHKPAVQTTARDHHQNKDHGKKQAGHHRPTEPTTTTVVHSKDHRGDDVAADSGPRPAQSATPESSVALQIFRRRILPILQAKNPSSCTECHLSGVDLKDYILPDQAKTFAALRKRGLINIEQPEKSKILKFIARKPSKPSVITQRVRNLEYEAFRAWIIAGVKDPALLKARAGDALGAKLPDAVIRHARKDRVLASFIDNVWSEVGRCAACHSPDRNQKQVRKHGPKVSWIKLRDPQATLDYMIKASLIDPEFPEDSLILAKPTLQVEHVGGRKMVVGDRTYKQFRRFIDDYAAVVNGKYRTAAQLPKSSREVSHSSGIWFKITDVPRRFDKKLMQVDLYRRDGRKWSKIRWATADRPVAGKRYLWQQQLSLVARRGSKRAAEIRHRQVLPPGEYLVKVFIDRTGKLKKDYKSRLGADDLVGQAIVDSRWRPGFGRMTVLRFTRLKSR